MPNKEKQRTFSLKSFEHMLSGKLLFIHEVQSSLLSAETDTTDEEGEEEGVVMQTSIALRHHGSSVPMLLGLDFFS